MAPFQEATENFFILQPLKIRDQSSFDGVDNFGTISKNPALT
jgi:hypothetical protein